MKFNSNHALLGLFGVAVLGSAALLVSQDRKSVV